MQQRTRQRLEVHAKKNYAGQYVRLDIRFRGAFCYVDAYVEPTLTPGWPPPGWHETAEQMLERLRSTPKHLCRLRHFSADNWSLAFYTYSNETYEPAMFHSGSFFGTPEEGFDVGAMYLEE